MIARTLTLLFLAACAPPAQNPPPPLDQAPKASAEPGRRILPNPRPNSDGEFGFAVVSLDFDGDGELDLAISAPGAGAVYVFEGPELEHSRRFAPPTHAKGDAFGYSLAAGPVDSHPGDELLVGSPGADVGELRAAGRIWLVSSRPDVQSPIPVHQDSPEAKMRIGNSVAIGDFDGDGQNDLATGGPKALIGGAPSGTVYFHSVARGEGWRVDNPIGSWKHGNFGHVLAVADGNGDGRDDLFISSLGNRNQAGIKAAGQCYVLFGPVPEDGEIPPEKIALIEDPTANQGDGARFGMSIFADDVNGDGYADFLIGAPRKDNGEVKDAGIGFLFMGPEFKAENYRRFERPDPKQDDILGFNSLIADVVGDEAPDVIIASLSRLNPIGLVVWDGGTPSKDPIILPRLEGSGAHYVRALARGRRPTNGRHQLLLGDSDFSESEKVNVGRVVIEQR